MLQNATSLRKSAAWLPNISDEHVSCTAPATENVSLQILFTCSTPANAFETAAKPSRFAHFWQGAQSPAPATQNDIWTSKSAPYPSVFSHFWFGNVLRTTTACTFPTAQLPKVLRHCTFWLPNLHAATTACTFSTSQVPKVVRQRFVLCILTWTCASRHNGVHFSISHLATCLRTRRFSESTFRPSGATNHWKKTQCFATFLPFRAPGSSLFWDFLFFDLLSSSLLFSDPSHLCFSSVHIVGCPYCRKFHF